MLIDISDGKAFELMTLPVSQMGMTIAPFDKPHPVMHIQPLAVTASGTLPDTLTTMPALPSLDGLTQRKLQLSIGPDARHDGYADADAKVWRPGDGGNGSWADDGAYESWLNESRQWWTYESRREVRFPQCQ